VLGLAPRLIAGTGIPLSPQEFMDTMQVKLEQAFKHTTVLPGIQKLVSHLHKHNIPIAVSRLVVGGQTETSA